MKTAILKSRAGSALLQSFLAISVVSTVFYFSSNILLSNKKTLLKSSDIVFSRLLLQSITDYLATGIKQEWCVDNSFMHDKRCDSDFNLKYEKTNVSSLGRLVINESYAEWISRMTSAGLFDPTRVATDVHPPDKTSVNYFKGIILPYTQKTIDLSSIGTNHPLREMLDTSIRASFIRKIRYTIERDTTASLPKYGKEVFLKLVVELLDRDDEVIAIGSNGSISNAKGCIYKGKEIHKCGAYVFVVESLFSTYPRELNSFSLIAANSLYLTDGIKKTEPGDLKIPMLQTRSSASTYRGINFESPVFVNNDIFIPLPTEIDVPDEVKPYSPVRFMDKVIIGSGKVYAQNQTESIEYSPSVTSKNYGHFWSEEPTFGGFLQGVYLDGETDNGLKVLSNRIPTNLNSDKMNLCIARNLSLMDLQTANGSELIANISEPIDVSSLRSQDISLAFSKPNPPALGLTVKYDSFNRFKLQDAFANESIEFKSEKGEYSVIKVISTKTTKSLTAPALNLTDPFDTKVWRDSDASMISVKNTTTAYPSLDINSDGIYEFGLKLNGVHKPVAKISVSWDGGKSEVRTFIPLNGELTIERSLNMLTFNNFLLTEMNNSIDDVVADISVLSGQSSNGRIEYVLHNKDNLKIDDLVQVSTNNKFSISKALNDIPDLTKDSNFKTWLTKNKAYAPQKNKFDHQLTLVKTAFTKIRNSVQIDYDIHAANLAVLKNQQKNKQIEIDAENIKITDSQNKLDVLGPKKKKFEDDYSFIDDSTNVVDAIDKRQADIAKANSDKAVELAKLNPDQTKINDLTNKIINWTSELAVLQDYLIVKNEFTAETTALNGFKATLATLTNEMNVIDTKVADKQKIYDDFHYQICILDGCSNEAFPSRSISSLTVSPALSLFNSEFGRIITLLNQGLQIDSNTESLKAPAKLTFKSEPYSDSENPIPLEDYLVRHRIKLISTNMKTFRQSDGSKSNFFEPEIRIEGYDLASSREKDHPTVARLIAESKFSRRNKIKIKTTNSATEFSVSKSLSDQILLDHYFNPLGPPTQEANLPGTRAPDSDTWFSFERSCIQVSDNKSIVAIDSSAAFKPLAWTQSLTNSAKISWDFATQGSYINSVTPTNPTSLFNSSEPMDSSKRDFIFPDEPTFLVRSILHDCIVPSTVSIVTGFFTCQNLIIQPRTDQLRIIGTMIITNSLSIDPTALEHGIYWSNIYNPASISILQNLPKPVLKPEIGTLSKCKDLNIKSPIWHPSPPMDYIANFYKCSPLALKAKANPFSWTMVDPDCGIVSSTSSSVTCKNHIRKINVVEIYRRSSL